MVNSEASRRILIRCKALQSLHRGKTLHNNGCRQTYNIKQKTRDIREMPPSREILGGKF